ncbi:hypothetical protein [Desulfoscipio geothermicus]|uniref:Lipoprotein n=1 Tax=Desulfoscipio geothermicus DSM 3669 TaxID=1121426 RepID=A0A1I6DUD4_9FIRM|nr:hypothetical protein [Desulfoscipio geothermicus]SFR09120.1 hypothetical protein SAMN05660706_11812 [Desulfoscipio geothermicus DSM 3669]
MKLNKLLLVLILAFISATAIGCGSNTEALKEPSKEDNAATVSEGEKVVFPEEKPALIGQVKDVIGNEVTVYKLQDSLNEGTPSEGRQEPTGQEINPNVQGPGPGNRAGFKVTGETETFIIPVGTPIVTVQRGTNETTPMGLTEIKKDQMLRVWKKNDAVSFVQVMGGNGPRTGNPEGANGQRPGNGQGFGGMGGMGGNRQP